MDWTQIYTEDHYRQLASVLESPVLFAKEACDLDLHDYQQQYVDFIQQHQKTMTIKARQTGITSITMAYIYWYCCVNSHRTVIVVGSTHRASVALVEMIRSWLIQGPSFFTQLVTSTNTQQVEFNNKSRIIAIDPVANSFRGYSSSIVYLDDFAFVDPVIQKDIIACAMPSITATRGKMIISTGPRTSDDQVYRIWDNKLPDSNSFEKLVLPYQCKFSEEFANQQRMLMGNEGFKQEYECKFTK